MCPSLPLALCLFLSASLSLHMCLFLPLSLCLFLYVSLSLNNKIISLCFCLAMSQHLSFSSARRWHGRSTDRFTGQIVPLNRNLIVAWVSKWRLNYGLGSRGDPVWRTNLLENIPEVIIASNAKFTLRTDGFVFFFFFSFYFCFFFLPHINMSSKLI